MTLYLGKHMSVSKGIVNAVEETHKMGCNVLQIFAKSPQSTRYKCKFKDAEIEKANKLNNPPIVGVPVLKIMWFLGPSDRIGWPFFCVFFNIYGL